MKTWISTFLVMTLGLSLSGCSTTPSDSSKAYIGMFSGAVIGGLSGGAARPNGGGHFNYVAVGALLGALVGGGLGMVLDEKDQAAKIASTSTTQNDSQDKTFRITTSTHQPIQQQTRQPASTTASNKAKSVQKNISMNDKLRNFWKSLPSTQWFFDTGRQADVG